MTLLYVFIGGGVGASLRYLIGVGVHTLFPRLIYPLSTFIVNLIGSLLIGILVTYFDTHKVHPAYKAMLITGLLGALTTFSTYSLELIQLLEDKRFVYATLHFILNNICCLGLTWFGFKLLR